MKLAIVRGKFLNAYEMQIFEPLVNSYVITAFGSLNPYQDTFTFPVVKLPSPMDIPSFPFKMQVLNRLFVDAHYLFDLERELRGYDIVHSAETYFYYTQQCLNAKKKGYVKKVVATVLENIPFNNEGIHGRRAFKMRAREQLDHIIALTNRTKEALLLEGADPAKITVIGHGINTKVFFPKKDWIKKIGDHKRKQVNILYVGRLEICKGVFELLYAIKQLVSNRKFKNYHIRARFIGSGSKMRDMLVMEKRLGIDSVISHEVLPYTKIPECYHWADLFIAPSKADTYWQEQYNTALLEAQASGLPIVTTLSGGIPENVGEAGVLVQPADIVSLTEGIEQLICNPKLRVTYARKARKRAETVHDVTIIARKLEHVYQRVLRM